MRRFISAGITAAAIVASSGMARAQEGEAPSAERIRSAAAEYDAGRRAFIEKKFSEAATHFENAYHDAPRAEALRNAIRARREAKQYARAATLAALAQDVYPSDETTMVVVRDTLAEAAPKLHRLIVQCQPACGIVVDGRAITQDDAPKTTLFLEPGVHAVVVSFGEAGARQERVTAKAGGHQELELVPPPPAPPPAEPEVQEPIRPAPTAADAGPRRTKPFGPAVFIVGAGLTAVGAALTTVSGIDTLNSPGQDRVRAECAGQGEACSLYQEGRDAQLRTNVLLGVTAGVAVITAAVGLFLTDWKPGAPAPANAARFLPRQGPGGLRWTF